MKTRTLILSVAMLFLVSAGAKAQTATQILAKVDAIASAPRDVTQKLTIVLIDKNGRKQTRKAVMWQKGSEKRLFRFTEPASYKGIGILSLPNDVMYLYMPAYGRERRIASSVKNQKFAGTDLTYDDMEASKYSEKYTPEIIETTSTYYKLKMTPKSKSSPYSKAILKVDKTNYTPIYVEFYDKGGHKVKTISTQFVKQGKYWTAQKITVKDLKRNHTTIMESTDVKYDTDLSDNIFTVRNLKQI